MTAHIRDTTTYPMQPIAEDERGVMRFERNPIVDWLCREKSNMNEIAIYAAVNGIDEKYQQQIAQLIGYSISGYGSLSYVDDKSYDRATQPATDPVIEALKVGLTPEQLQAFMTSQDGLQLRADAGRAGFIAGAAAFGFNLDRADELAGQHAARVKAGEL